MSGTIVGQEYSVAFAVTDYTIQIQTSIDLPIGRTIRIGDTEWRLEWDEGIADGQQIALCQNVGDDCWQTLAVGPELYARRTLADFLSHALLMQIR